MVGNNGYDVRVKRTLTIRRSPRELYQVWRSQKLLAGFTAGAESVQEFNDRRSHWTVKVPGYGQASWEAEIIDDRENEAIGWRTVGQTDFEHEGLVTFKPAPNNLGTEVSFEINTRMPGGVVANTVSKVTGQSPEDYISHTLHNFKQLMETGEMATNMGPSGRMRVFTGVGPKVAMAGTALAVMAALLYSRKRAGGEV